MATLGLAPPFKINRPQLASNSVPRLSCTSAWRRGEPWASSAETESKPIGCCSFMGLWYNGISINAAIVQLFSKKKYSIVFPSKLFVPLLNFEIFCGNRKLQLEHSTVSKGPQPTEPPPQHQPAWPAWQPTLWEDYAKVMEQLSN